MSLLFEAGPLSLLLQGPRGCQTRLQDPDPKGKGSTGDRGFPVTVAVLLGTQDTAGNGRRLGGLTVDGARAHGSVPWGGQEAGLARSAMEGKTSPDRKTESRWVGRAVMSSDPKWGRQWGQGGCPGVERWEGFKHRKLCLQV